MQTAISYLIRNSDFFLNSNYKYLIWQILVRKYKGVTRCGVWVTIQINFTWIFVKMIQLVEDILRAESEIISCNKVVIYHSTL